MKEIDKIDRFSPEVCKKLNYYVYKLIDPTNGEVFYIGKGSNNRIFDHCKGALGKNDQNENEFDLKNDRIKKILSSGLDVLPVIVRYGLEEDDAFIVESVLINEYPGLTNAQSGHDSDYGPVSAWQIEYLLKAEPAQMDRSMLILKTNDAWYIPHLNDIRNARKIGTWRLNIDNAKKYNYVALVVNRLFKNIFIVSEKDWYEDDGRWGFNGKTAEKDVLERYVERKIPEEMCVHSSQPVRYYDFKK